ncbi:hypothetical protein LINPERPRIM_LOCUS26615 [Linum perenne]
MRDMWIINTRVWFSTFVS